LGAALRPFVDRKGGSETMAAKKKAAKKKGKKR
jgi:hypothetical protein